MLLITHFPTLWYTISDFGRVVVDP